MSEQDLKTLYALVRAAVTAVGTEFVVECIWDCHNGRLDGVLCTPGSLHLFRQYRNTVSANPRHLIDAALDAAVSRRDAEA